MTVHVSILLLLFLAVAVVSGMHLVVQVALRMQLKITGMQRCGGKKQHCQRVHPKC
jgi:type II secretory pathway component PulK